MFSYRILNFLILYLENRKELFKLFYKWELTLKSLGELIAFYRQKSGLSAAELGRKLDLPRSLINNYEKNRRYIDIKRLIEIANQIHAPPEKLLEAYFYRKLENSEIKGFAVKVKKLRV